MGQNSSGVGSDNVVGTSSTNSELCVERSMSERAVTVRKRGCVSIDQCLKLVSDLTK